MGHVAGMAALRGGAASKDDPVVVNPKKRSAVKRPRRALKGQRSNFSPKLWDSLSKIWLTPRALRELDRRNNLREQDGHLLQPPASTEYSHDLARFARLGGPDQRHLRRYAESGDVVHPMGQQSKAARRGLQTQSAGETSAEETDVLPKVRKSSAYDENFEQYLEGYNIFLHENANRVYPYNLAQIQQRLSNRRSSISLSGSDERDFDAFRSKNHALSKASLMRRLIPTLLGGADFPTESNLPFTNLSTITNDRTVKAVPDLYDGVKATDVDQDVRKHLSKMIIPTKHGKKAPVVPNFFLEVKSLKGTLDVAWKQAGYDGAHGCRAIQALRNYAKEEPMYDGNAYTFSSTYVDGILRIFAHYITPPTEAGKQPEYNMIQVGSWDAAWGRTSFLQAATAIRNCRDMAMEYRHRFVRAANAKARGSMAAPHESSDAEIHAAPQQDHVDEGGDSADLQPASSKGRKDPQGHRSTATRQASQRHTGNGWEHVETRRYGEGVRFEDPQTREEIQTSRKDWVPSFITNDGEQKLCWKFESKTLGRTFCSLASSV